MPDENTPTPHIDRVWARDTAERVISTVGESACGGFVAWVAAQHLDNSTLVGVAGLAAAAGAAALKARIAKLFGNPASASLDPQV